MEEGKNEGEEPQQKFTIEPFSNVRRSNENEMDNKQSRPFEDNPMDTRDNEQTKYDNEQPRYDNYQPPSDNYRPREERQTELQPQNVELAKHWYDEFPVEDRRKQLQESVQRRKMRKSQDEQFLQNEFARSANYDRYGQQPLNGYENTRDRSSDNAEARFEFRRSPRFDQNDLNDVSDKKYYSRSYNRSGHINKRTFVKPNPDQDEGAQRINPGTPVEHRNFGKSANHGMGRNFRNYAEPTFNPKFSNGMSNRCDIKFNTQSANYDMSEIELPAYCKNHPDGKLLYIITPHGYDKESDLGCVYCALELNNQKDKYTIVEVKQKLDEYISHTSELLRSKPRQNVNNADEAIMKIGICKDREIAMIRQYYDKMMEALAFERDKHISHITQMAEDNIASLAGAHISPQGSKPSKNDIKLKNFGIELGKVLDGVEETGIHIKELWKINQDYNDVVKQKVAESSQGLSNGGSQSLNSFEFHIADENRLKELAQRVGQVITRPVDVDYFFYDEYDNSNRRSPNKYSESYSSYGRFDSKTEHVPTFGINNQTYDPDRNVPKEPPTYTESQYQYKSKYEPYDSSKYKYSGSTNGNPTQVTDDRKSTYSHSANTYTGNGYSNDEKPTYNYKNGDDRNYTPTNTTHNYQKYSTYNSSNVIKDDETRGYSHSHQNGFTSDHKSRYSEHIDGRQAQSRNINDRDPPKMSSIEEIKKKYAKDAQTAKMEPRSVEQMYNDYKEKVVDSNMEKEIALAKTPDREDKVNTYYKDFKEKNNNNKEAVSTDVNEGKSSTTSDDKKAPPKKIFKKLKTKVKGDKENVLKTIKLKLK